MAQSYCSQTFEEKALSFSNLFHDDRTDVDIVSVQVIDPEKYF